MKFLLIIDSSYTLGNVYGNCCGGNCGGYEGGKSAIKHAKDGLFDDSPYTEWIRGEPAEVYWFASADHRGGYAYRLCKVTFLYVDILEENFKFAS